MSKLRTRFTHSEKLTQLTHLTTLEAQVNQLTQEITSLRGIFEATSQSQPEDVKAWASHSSGVGGLIDNIKSTHRQVHDFVAKSHPSSSQVSETQEFDLTHEKKVISTVYWRIDKEIKAMSDSDGEAEQKFHSIQMALRSIMKRFGGHNQSAVYDEPTYLRMGLEWANDVYALRSSLNNAVTENYMAIFEGVDVMTYRHRGILILTENDLIPVISRLRGMLNYANIKYSIPSK